MGIVNNEDDGDAERTGEIQSEMKKFLKSIKGDSVLAFLSLSEGEEEEEATLQVLWDVDSPEVRAHTYIVRSLRFPNGLKFVTTSASFKDAKAFCIQFFSHLIFSAFLSNTLRL